METVGCYLRVSTEDQSIDRQRVSTTDYAQNQLGVSLPNIEYYRDKSTGTDVKREGYENLITDVKDGKIDTVVVSSVSRLSRSIRDLDDTANEITSNGCDLHFVSESLIMKPDSSDPFQNAMFQILGVMAELEAKMIQERVREGIRTRMENEDYHHGPAPLGFDKHDGRLIESNEYDRVRSVLEMVDSDELSKRKAARELDTSRRTINRALDRKELYQID